MNELDNLCASESVRAWDRQIRLFARYFLAHVDLPVSEPFILLDVGCGTGSALSEIKARRPLATLYGCDIEELHVQISRRLNGDAAEFFQSDIASVSGTYNYIYVSNLLEHVSGWQEALMHLCTLARYVFVLVPYREDLAEQKSSGVEHVDHVNSYDHQSFDFLISQGFAVRKRVIRTAYAWGPPLHCEWVAMVKGALSGRRYKLQREILVEISRLHSNVGAALLQQHSIRNPFSAFLSSVGVTQGLPS